MLSVLAAFYCFQQSSRTDDLRLDPAYLQAEMLRCSLYVAYNLNALNLETFRIKKKVEEEEKERKEREKKRKQKKRGEKKKDNFSMLQSEALLSLF